MTTAHKETDAYQNASGGWGSVKAVAGALITLLVGTTRIVQLRREVHRQHRAAKP